MNVLTLISALKQICNGVQGDNAKLDWLLNYVDIARDEGDKVLVFSQFVETLNAIEPDLHDFAPLKYTGAQSDRIRTATIDRFQAAEGAPWILLMSLKAGGVGITLTRANHVVHFDSWWNPAVMSQATARAHRIGQSKAVVETTLVATDTVEERIQVILSEKRQLFGEVVDDLSTQGLARVLTTREIYGLFGLEPPIR